MKYCTNCNAPIDDNAKYCTQCGAEQSQQASNLHADALAQYSRRLSNRTLAIASLIVGIAFACFFAATACLYLSDMTLYWDVFWIVMGIILYLAAAALSVVAGGYLYSCFSKRQ